MIKLNCNAKINLSLDVTGKRDDGYHDVELIFNEITLCDTLEIDLRKDGKICLECDDKSLPNDNGNIAYRGAEAFFDYYGTNYGADIILTKKIPHGAGLAGGSADAAGVLKGLNMLCGNPFDINTLQKIGAKLGADVPFCIQGGCAFAEGIGEILTEVKKPKGLYYVIVKPKDSISTAFVYKNLDFTQKPDSMNVRKACEALNNDDMESFYKYCGNIMESVTAKEVKDIDKIKRLMLDLGARVSMMSGSGTAVFGIFEDKNLAKSAVEKSKEFYKDVFLV